MSAASECTFSDELCNKLVVSSGWRAWAPRKCWCTNFFFAGARTGRSATARKLVLLQKQQVSLITCC